MRLYLLLLFLFVSITDAAAQISKKTKELWRRDSLAVQEIRLKTEYLPKDLRGEMEAMENAINNICKDSEYGEYCADIHPKFKLLKTRINDVIKYIDDFRTEKQIIGDTFRHIEHTLKMQPGMTERQYTQMSATMLAPHVTKANRLLNKIKKSEGRLLKYAFRYLRKEYWSKSPVITTVIREYLEKIRQEKIDSLKKEQHDLWQLETEQHENLTKSQQDIIDSLESLIQKNYAEKEALEKNKIELEQEYNDLNTSLFEKNDTLGRKKAMIDKSNLSITQLNKELATLRIKRDSVKIISEKLEGKKRDLLYLQTELSRIENNLKQKEDTIKKLETNIDSLRQEKESLKDLVNDKSTQARYLKYALGFLVFIGLFQLYQRLLQERRARKKLQNMNGQLEEKREKLEALLRELHHRTKNNLQEISSLLYLQGKDSGDPEVKEVLNEARARIDALGIVHRQLYQDKRQRFDAVDISSYTRELVEQLLKGNNYFKEHVYMTYDLPTRYINTDTVIQIGLIINELVQNSCKYAFPGNPEPKLSIVMREEDNRLYMTVSDNGKGFPADFKMGAVSSFGLKLVNMLSKNTLQCENGTPGAIFRLNILLQPEEEEEEEDHYL